MKLRTLWFAAGAAIFFVAALLAFVVLTPSGARWAVERLTADESLGLVVTDIQGTLWSGLQARELRYRSDAADVTVEQLRLAVEPRDLFVPRLTLRDASADAVRVVIHAADSEGPAPASMPSSPVDVRIPRLTVGRLAVSGPGYAETATNVRLAGELRDDTVQVTQLSLEIRDVSINSGGRFELANTLPLTIELQWDAAGRNLSGQGTIVGNLRQLEIEHRVFTPDVVRLFATVDEPLDALSYSARLAAERLSIVTDGTSYEITDLSASLTGDANSVDVTAVKLTALDGAVRASGDLELAAPFPVRGRLIANTLNVAAIRPDLDGRIDFAAALDGTLDGNQVVTIETLAGEINQQRFQGSGTLRRDVETLTLSDATLGLGANSALLDGQLLPELSIEFELAAPRLAELPLNLSGALSATGIVGGSIEAPVVDVSGEARSLSAGEMTLNAATFDAQIGENGELNAAVALRDVRRGRQQFELANVNIVGQLTDYSLTATLIGEPLSAELSGKGGYANGQVRQVTTSASIDLGELGVWSNDQPFGAEFFIADGRFRISAHCWRQNDAAICLAPTVRSDEALTAGVDISTFPAGTLNPWLPAGIRMEGTADASLSASLTSGKLRALGTLRQRGLRVTATDDAGKPKTLVIDSIDMSVTADNASAVAEVAATANNASVDAELRIAEPLKAVRPLTGRIELDLENLDDVAPLIEIPTGLRDVFGSLQAAASLGGTVSEPRIEGGIELRGGRGVVPAAGIDIEEIQLTINGTESGRARLDGSARSGDGTVTLRGDIDLARRSAQIAVAGERFTVLRLPDQEAIASPDLTIDYSPERVAVEGRLIVPEAAFLVREIPEAAAVPSPDTVIHAPDAPRDERRQPVLADIEIGLGDDVTFSGFGLTTSIAGDLKLRQDERQQLFADGLLRLRGGRFEAYGQKLTIDRGTLIFAGPLDNPTLDVRASRSVRYGGDTVIAGVLLSGPADNITTRVFSEPPLSEANALSYLVLGRPIDAAGGDDSAALTNAAISMGLRRALPIVESLGDTVGLDEVGIGGDTTDDTAFLAGKQINEDLSIRYTYGLFSRIGTFIASYALGGGFSIEGRSGEGQSLELVYAVER